MWNQSQKKSNKKVEYYWLHEGYDGYIQSKYKSRARMKLIFFQE